MKGEIMGALAARRAATPRIRLWNTFLEDVLVLLRDGPRTTAALGKLLIGEGEAVPRSTVSRAVHSLLRHELIRYQGGHATLAEAEAATAKLHALLDGDATEKDAASLVSMSRGLELTEKGRACAEFVASRRVLERGTKHRLPPTLLQKVSRSFYEGVLANA